MKTGKIRSLSVSPVGMGCMELSHGYGKVPEREYSINAIRKTADFGCTFFDTAEVYGHQQFWFGYNEELVGEALKGFRKEVVVATKYHLKEDVE